MDSFCVLPWFNKEIGANTSTTHCCLLPRNYDIEKIRNSMLNGARPEECQKCWKIEDQGEDSRRIQENRFLDWKLDRDLDKIQEDCRQNQAVTMMYQIECSNLCNQACVTCNGSASTKWQELERKTYGLSVYQPKYLDIDRLDIDYQKAQRINFVGGEPTFDPRTFQILEKLLDSGNTNCFISFVTNGSIVLNHHHRELLKNFKNLNICFSIDGIDKRFEYMRWPGKWDTLLSNLDSYREVTENFSVSYTISAVNAIYYDETVEWFKKQSLRYNHNIVNFPSWASLNLAPIEIKNMIRTNNFLDGFSHVNGNETTKEDLLNELKKQDQMKKIHFKNYMPELYELLTA